MWTTIADGVTDVRRLISDGPTDKQAYRKRCIGDINGTNKTFKTFERRRLTNFLTAAAPLGVFVDGAAQVATADDLTSGEVTITSAPAAGTVVEATYFYQWFLDSEVEGFLVNATQWLGLGINPTVVPDGLIPACIHFAGQEAMHKISVWWSTKQSEMYQMQDAPDDKRNQGPVDMYLKLAKQFHDKAIELRDGYYTRQGQNLAPAFRNIPGRVRRIVPNR